jgi:hypothetical protein
VRWARGAGSIIVEGDRLIRPSQDCSAGYGHSIVFNEIKLSDTTYEEEQVSQLLPDALGNPITGVHTFNRVGDWEVIDGRRPRKQRSLF